MVFFAKSVILFLILLLIGSIILLVIRNNTSGLKIMLLGINITLFGGIFAADSNSSLGGIEYLIAIIGMVISVIGLVMKN